MGSAPESFRGHPVQLSDGSIVDSATLLPGVEGHPVMLSGGSIIDSGTELADCVESPLFLWVLSRCV